MAPTPRSVQALSPFQSLPLSPFPTPCTVPHSGPVAEDTQGTSRGSKSPGTQRHEKQERTGQCNVERQPGMTPTTLLHGQGVPDDMVNVGDREQGAQGVRG